jgi:ABC-type sugar transport system ATPase subunit
MSLQIEFRGTTKSFGPVQVLHGVDFILPTGQVLGLLGENGAGKSTLMKILAGFEPATGGSLLINGTEQTCSWATRKSVAGAACCWTKRPCAPRRRRPSPRWG